MLLSGLNTKRKVYFKALIGILARLLPYPGYKRLLDRVNRRVVSLGVNLCIWPPETPFNLEHLWFEAVFGETPWRFGVLTNELFANHDDDNGAYKESLIKRGLYPFQAQVEQGHYSKQKAPVNFRVHLRIGELYDCTYFSRNGRIRKPPVVHILVESGKVNVVYQSSEIALENGSGDYFYANKNPVIRSRSDSTIILSIFDEDLR
ncbi:MAG: hypothetical protein ABIG11_10025 [bacterium]